MANRYEQEQIYKRWWVGKKCRISKFDAFKLVKDVEVFGPPSFVYGSASLIFEDGSEQTIPCGEAFKPRKQDVEVQQPI
jgi:hypothetical protein